MLGAASHVCLGMKNAVFKTKAEFVSFTQKYRHILSFSVENHKNNSSIFQNA